MRWRNIVLVAFIITLLVLNVTFLYYLKASENCKVYIIRYRNITKEIQHWEETQPAITRSKLTIETLD